MAKKITAPISTSIRQDKNIDAAPKADIIMLVSCINSNPNGDPDDEGRPRCDTEGHAVISNGSTKRKVRDTITAYTDPSVGFFEGEEDKNKIFVERNSIRTQQMATVLDLKGRKELASVIKANDVDTEGSSGEGESGAKGKGKKSPTVSREDRAYVAKQLCDNYLDTRLFGQCLGTIGAIEGAVQIENAVSVNVVDVDDMCITATQVANETQATTKGDRTMGRSSGVKFALFPIYIHVNGIRAKQNGLTRKDFDRFLDILSEMYEQTNSSVRNLQFEQMFVFEHDNVRGSMSMKDIREAVQFKTTKESPTSMNDIKIMVNENKIKSHKGIKFYTR